MKKTSFLALGILLLTSCLEQEPVPNAEARNRVQAFAEAYFNYDFQRAAELVTPESMKWLRFAASNITQQDIDMLNAQETPTVVDVTDYWQAPGDSMGTATVEVTDYLQKKARGYAVPESFNHGTSKQRMKWFKLGLETGDISKGTTFQCSDAEL